MTTNIILETLFSLGLLICVWYFLIKDKEVQIDDNFDELTIKLDDYEKELNDVIKYPKNGEPTSYTGVNLNKEDIDWKQIDRENLNDTDYETLYQETKTGEKIVNKTMDIEQEDFGFRNSSGEVI